MWALLLPLALLGQQLDFSALDSQLAAMEQERLLLVGRQNQLNESLKESQQNMEIGQRERLKLYQGLRKRLLTYKSLQPTVKTTLLTQSKSISESLSNLALLRQLTRQDRLLVRKIEDNQLRLALLKADLLQKQQDLATLNRQLMDQQDQLAQLRLDTMKVLLTEAGQATAAAAEQDFSSQKGYLPWPLSGEVITTFGLNKDQANNNQMSHGLIIAAAVGTAVTAVGSGEVIFSGPVPGYHELTIIDHGNDYYSIYGHLSRAALPVHSKVETHQVVGLVAGAQWPDQQGLYFELRHKKVAFDPQPWLQAP